MRFGINDIVISEFMSGLIIVVALIMVGGLLEFLLRKMADRYPFTRLALILALTPVSLLHFLDQDTRYLLFTYMLIVATMGVTIDGIRYLFEFRAQLRITAELEAERIQSRRFSEEPAVVVGEVSVQKDAPQPAQDHKPNVLVWERVE